MKFDHVAVYVKDIKTATEWYVENIGAEVLYLDDTWSFLKVSGSKIALTLKSQHPAHICFEITEKERVERLKKMTPEKNAPLAVFLASAAAKEVTGQIFSARLNELFIYNQNRPVKSVHSETGWTPQQIAERALPSFKNAMTPNERSGDVFSWDPI